jgi:GDPmannose 4,6-dehydratase
MSTHGTAFRKALIFGSSGQDGFYLMEACRRAGIESIGVSRTGSGILCDVSNRAQVFDVISSTMPDMIFQLAAESTTAHSALFGNHAAISTGTLNVLEAARVIAPTARVFIPGSGIQFRNTGAPISEHDPFEAKSPYAISRIHSTYAARYFRHLGLRAYVGYLFHHESPVRQNNHVSKKITNCALRVSWGEHLVMDIGDPDVEKEWTFAGDIADAILLFIQQDDVYECVIGSGEAHSIREWIETCFGLLNLDWDNHIKTADSFAAEYKRLVSNPSTIFRLGWKPRVTFRELAKMMLREPRDAEAQGQG